MRRRLFMKGSLGVATGLVHTEVTNAQSAASPLPIARSSRLFDPPTDSKDRAMIQDTFFWNGVIYCMYFVPSKRHWSVTATSAADGNRIWQRDLPKGTYLGMGVRQQDLLLHALTYYDQTDRAHPNCLLRLDRAGNVNILGPLGSESSAGLHFAGESLLARIGSNTVEIWSATDSGVTRVGSTGITRPLGGSPHIDLLPSHSLSLTAKDGTTIVAVDAQTCSVTEHPICSPKITSALSAYRQSSSPDRGNPVVLPATGTDLNGSLYALVLPTITKAIQAIKFDSFVTASEWHWFELPSRVPGMPHVPLKLLFAAPGIGMIYPDGKVVWYAV